MASRVWQLPQTSWCFLVRYCSSIKPDSIVDYSQRAVALADRCGLVTGVVVLALTPFWQSLSPWVTLIGKGLLITVLYVGILWLTEREQLRSWLADGLGNSSPPPPTNPNEMTPPFIYISVTDAYRIDFAQ